MAVDLREAREARAALVKAIEEKGADYVYAPPAWAHQWNDYGQMVVAQDPSECVYAAPKGPDDETLVPCCIIGHAVYQWGGPEALAEAHRHEGDNAGEAVPWVDEVVTRALIAAQRRQDAGDTWGAALAKFDTIVSAAVHNPDWMKEGE